MKLKWEQRTDNLGNHFWVVAEEQTRFWTIFPVLRNNKIMYQVSDRTFDTFFEAAQHCEECEENL